MGSTRARGIAVDDPGNAYVTGYTNSTDFPTVNAVQPTFGGGARRLRGEARVAPKGRRGRRIARESEREYWPIMETLTAYVRERAPWPPRQAVANPSNSRAAVWAKRPENAQSKSRRTRLNQRARTDLRGAHLAGAHLEGADLKGAMLQGAHLREAVGLTQEQLGSAFGNDRMALPEGLTRPKWWLTVTPEQAAVMDRLNRGRYL